MQREYVTDWCDGLHRVHVCGTLIPQDAKEHAQEYTLRPINPHLYLVHRDEDERSSRGCRAELRFTGEVLSEQSQTAFELVSLPQLRDPYSDIIYSGNYYLASGMPPWGHAYLCHVVKTLSL